jgi:hypothetical protein
MDFIRQSEERVIEYCIKQLGEEFSLDTFKVLYDGMSTDLCDMLEGKFREYLFHFFWDEGNPAMRDVIHYGGPYLVPFNLLNDFRRMFKPELYKKLIENSFYHATPYLPLYGFKDGPKKGDPVIFSVMEWQDRDVKEKFKAYLERVYPFVKSEEVVKEVDTWAKKYLTDSDAK